jgi:hypothetical protein
MNTSTEILNGLWMLRRLLDHPSKLSKTALGGYQRQAQELGDACYFNAGWHAVGAGKALQGAAATEALADRLRGMTLEVAQYIKPKRGRGRPKVEDIHPDYLGAVVVVSLGRPEQKRELIRLCLKEGWLKDREEKKDGVRTTTTFDAHVKQIDRELGKLERRRAARPPKNVLIFRPRKPSRRKIENK